MSGRTTLFLAALAIILGGYVYFFELPAPDESETDDPVVQIYDAPYSEYDIVALDIKTARRQAQFVRTHETLTQDWQMLSPDPLAPNQLDQARVNGAVVRLGRLTAEQVITNALNLAEYGLAPAALTVTLTLSNGQKILFRTGHQTPVSNNRYLQAESDSQAVYIVYGLAVDELYRLIESPPLRPTPLPPRSP